MNVWNDGTNVLTHHGILGQKWGIRRYQNLDGSLTEAGRKRYLNSDGTLTKKGAKRIETLNNYKREKVSGAKSRIGKYKQFRDSYLDSAENLKKYGPNSKEYQAYREAQMAKVSDKYSDYYDDENSNSAKSAAAIANLIDVAAKSSYLRKTEQQDVDTLIRLYEEKAKRYDQYVSDFERIHNNLLNMNIDINTTKAQIANKAKRETDTKYKDWFDGFYIAPAYIEDID